MHGCEKASSDEFMEEHLADVRQAEGWAVVCKPAQIEGLF